MDSYEVKIKIYPDIGDTFIVTLKVSADEAGNFIDEWIEDHLKNVQEWDYAD